MKGYSPTLNVNELIKLCLIHAFQHYPEAIAVRFLNKAPSSLEKSYLLEDKFYTRFPDLIVPVREDFGNYWSEKNGSITPIQEDYDFRENKISILKEKILEGGIISFATIKKNKLDFSKKYLEKI